MARKARKPSKKTGKRKPRFTRKQITAMGLSLKDSNYDPEA
jgi:hypothetical protein